MLFQSRSLAAAVSLAPQSLLRANMPQYFKFRYRRFAFTSVCSMATRRWAGDPRNMGSVPGRGKRFFSLLHTVQSGCGTHRVCTGGSFLKVKRPERETGHSHPSVMEAVPLLHDVMLN
jgi:hypothetical protein